MPTHENSFTFAELRDAPLIIDATYEGGHFNNIKDDPISALLAGVGNQGGFRAALSEDKTHVAYVVIYSSGDEPEWPDEIDVRTGLFRYYGDNRKPGSRLHQTKRMGNRLLEDVFAAFHEGRMEDIPPFLVFRKTGRGRDVRFIGLAAPGHKNISTEDDLVASWYMMKGQRFKNLRASFTLLELDDGSVSREWLDHLRRGGEGSSGFAPTSWIEYTSKGRSALRPYELHVIDQAPTRAEQLPSPGSRGSRMLEMIYGRYTKSSNAYGFESCAVALVQMMDHHFIEIEQTRPWRDGGRDALGYYAIGPEPRPLKISCAIEAKCYESSNGVGVKEMSRLISRIKYREFGVMVTTSYVVKQAYQEVIEDGHPILVLSGKNIVEILMRHGINESNLEQWLDELEE